MDFFTEMKRSLESTGKQVAKKTKDFSESLQLKSKIAAEKDALETMYRSIGRQVYEHATEEEAERFAEEFLSIQKTLKRKVELEEELAALEGAVYCEECGAKLDRNAVFCSRCGSRVQAWRKAEAKETEREESEPAALEVKEMEACEDGAGEAEGKES
ncbi:MAG TPA: zinc ribbon domain-containing protein [Candidatus Copromonas avistercoris]|nr:zinc ribbon domain-containing protein [Candidatus Copromonas avistercoris]